MMILEVTSLDHGLSEVGAVGLTATSVSSIHSPSRANRGQQMHGDLLH